MANFAEIPRAWLDAIRHSPELPTPLPADPFAVLSAWLDEERRAGVTKDPDAIALATAWPDGRPSVRMVLCRRIHASLGAVAFFTNYESDKARALDANPHAAACFHWERSARQVRIEGPVTRSPASESDDYFKTRPLESRLGAWASQQSRPTGGRSELIASLAGAALKHVGPVALLGDASKAEVPRPPHWGGYRIWATRIELWMGGPGRLHDRAAWTRDLTPGGEGFVGGPWTSSRLQP